jgi:hypothetical protein
MGLFGNMFGQKQSPWTIDERGAIPGNEPSAQDWGMPQVGQAPASGLFGQQAQQQLQQPMSQMVQQPQHGGGFFAKDGLGPTIGGALSDWLLQANGLKPVVGPAQDARREYDQAVQLQAAKAAAAVQEHRANWDYDKAHPGPTEVEQRADYYRKIGRPDLAESYLVNGATAPPIVQKNADGTSTIYSQGMIPRGPSAPPAAPVGKLTPINPGGPTPQASGGFRPGW